MTKLYYYLPTKITMKEYKTESGDPVIVYDDMTNFWNNLTEKQKEEWKILWIKIKEVHGVKPIIFSVDHKKSDNEEWYLTIGNSVLQTFKNKKQALEYVKISSFVPFREIDKDHFIMGNMHLIPKSKLEYCL